MKCPRCGKEVEKGHAIWSAGSSLLGTKEEEELEALIHQRPWRDAREYNAAHLPDDIRAWHVLKCDDGTLTLTSQVLPFELWEDDRIEKVYELTEPEQEEIRRLAEGDWTVLGSEGFLRRLRRKFRSTHRD